MAASSGHAGLGAADSTARSKSARARSTPVLLQVERCRGCRAPGRAAVGESVNSAIAAVQLAHRLGVWPGQHRPARRAGSGAIPESRRTGPAGPGPSRIGASRSRGCRSRPRRRPGSPRSRPESRRPIARASASSSGLLAARTRPPLIAATPRACSSSAEQHRRRSATGRAGTRSPAPRRGRVVRAVALSSPLGGVPAPISLATRPATIGAANDVPLHTPKPPRKSSGSMASRGRPRYVGVALQAAARPGTAGRCSSRRRHSA